MGAGVLQACTSLAGLTTPAGGRGDSHCSSQRPGSTISRPWVSASSSQRRRCLVRTSCSRCCLRSASRSFALTHTKPWAAGDGQGVGSGMGTTYCPGPHLGHEPPSTLQAWMGAEWASEVGRGRTGAPTVGLTPASPKQPASACLDPGPRMSGHSCGNPHLVQLQGTTAVTSEPLQTPTLPRWASGSGLGKNGSYLLYVLGGLWTRVEGGVRKPPSRTQGPPPTQGPAPPDLSRVCPRGWAVPLQTLHVVYLVHLDLEGLLQRAGQGRGQVHPLPRQAGLAAQGGGVRQWGRDQSSPRQTWNGAGR